MRLKAVSSLTISFDAAPAPIDNESGWPDRQTCRAIQRSLQDAWLAGRPWSLFPQTLREGRFAPRNIFTKHGVAADVAKMMIETWLSGGVLVVEMIDSHSKLKGLRVETWID